MSPTVAMKLKKQIQSNKIVGQDLVRMKSFSKETISELLEVKMPFATLFYCKIKPYIEKNDNDNDNDMDPLTIYVRDGSNTNANKLCVNANDTVATAIQKYITDYGISAARDDMRWICRGRTLQKDKTLKYYDIKSHDFVFCSFPLKGTVNHQKKDNKCYLHFFFVFPNRQMRFFDRFVGVANNKIATIYALLFLFLFLFLTVVKPFKKQSFMHVIFKWTKHNKRSQTTNHKQAKQRNSKTYTKTQHGGIKFNICR